MSQTEQVEGNWMKYARCHTVPVDPRIFDGVQKNKYSPIDYSEARAFCAQCPMTGANGLCVADAIANDESACMRGGLTPDEVRRLKPDARRRSIPLKRKLVLV